MDYDTIMKAGSRMGTGLLMVVDDKQDIVSVVRNLEQEGVGLAVEGAARNDANKKLLDREEFLAKVWEWKAQSGGTIINQLKRLGASCDCLIY